MNSNPQLAAITGLIARSRSILIMVSRPVDPDCIGTACGLQWLLLQQKKDTRIVCFFPIPPIMADLPGIANVSVAEPAAFDFSGYDLFITVDGSSWGQFLGDDWKPVLDRLDKARICSIDHHEADEISRDIPERCLTKRSSSTAQVLYEHFIEPSGLTPPPAIADCLYRALLYDTRGFKNELHPGAYRLAETLTSLGADHAAAVDVNYDLREMRYLAWAIEHTEFLPELELMLLAIDAGRAAQLEGLLGSDYLEFDAVYKEVVQRQVAGYNYGIMLTDKNDGTVRLNWRTRGSGSHLAIAEVARAAGYNAGGHRNAGGGKFAGSLQDARNRLLESLRAALGK